MKWWPKRIMNWINRDISNVVKKQKRAIHL